MTSRIQPQCLPSCARFRSYLTTGAPGRRCEAFPDGIPEAIWSNRVDHRQPVEGDHGLRWTPREGAEFPQYALDAVRQLAD